MGRITYDPTRSKYTKELMEPIVKNSRSYCEVLRKLNLKMTGSANERIRLIIKKLNLDTSHFLGRASNCGPEKLGGNQKLLWQEILVYNRCGGKKEKVYLLRRALIESGIEEKCEKCGLGPVWNEEPLILQIDHRNGNFTDNRPGNPRFMCPNCHAQTPTFGSKNIDMTKLRGKKLWSKGRTKRRIWKDGHRILVDK